MPNLNKTMLMGNLTRDPELTYTAKGTPVAEFGIAVNEKRKDAQGNEKEETLFADVTFFGKVAEIIGKHLIKGRPVYIEGRLKLETWQDKTSGQQRSKMKIVGESFQFLNSGGGADSKGERTPREQPAKQPPPQPELPTGADDDIPF